MELRYMIKWFSKKVRVAELKEYEGNPREFTEKGLEELKKSIEKFGLAEPLCCNPDLTIIGGHARKKTLIELNIKEVNIFIPERKLSPSEIKELNVRLNKNEAGTWDFDLLIKNFDIPELKDIGFTNVELGLEIEAINVKDEWKDMPEYGNLMSKESFRSIIVHFKNKNDVDQFTKLINQQISDKTKFIWFPEVKRTIRKNLRYKGK